MAGKTIVYILGAGASAADGAPVTQKLILDAVLTFWSQPTGVNLSEFCPVLKEIDKMFGTNLENVIEKGSSTNHLTGNLNDADKVDVEEFLTEIENKAKKNCEGYKELRKKAHYFIFHPLCYETNLIHQSALKHYSAFVENVLKVGVGVKHRIITFNYDTLLERAICEKCSALPKERHLRWTHAVNFTSDISRIPYYVRDESIAEIFLLKLHGSFNWGWCPGTKEITMYPLADILQYEKLYSGQNAILYPRQPRQEPLLIPPTREKDLNISALQEVWKKAGDSLREATELHVIGYSAPEADKGARELILQELKPRINELEKVVLANKSANHRIKDLLSIANCKEYDIFREYLEREFHAELK